LARNILAAQRVALRNNSSLMTLDVMSPSSHNKRGG
jgi:hypothetical protein